MAVLVVPNSDEHEQIRGCGSKLDLKIWGVAHEMNGGRGTACRVQARKVGRESKMLKGRVRVCVCKGGGEIDKREEGRKLTATPWSE